MLSLTQGEWILTGAIFFSVVAPGWMMRAGEWLGARFGASSRADVNVGNKQADARLDRPEER
jgi:hypothetical protein